MSRIRQATGNSTSRKQVSKEWQRRVAGLDLGLSNPGALAEIRPDGSLACNPLGVLCVMAAEQGIVEREDDRHVDASEVSYLAPGCAGVDVAMFGGEFRELPEKVAGWAGVSRQRPEVPGMTQDLTGAWHRKR